jgi:hypothetical protein
MTHEQRLVREERLRMLLACGERGSVLQHLFGVSPRTIKRLLRQTATPVRTGRTGAPPRGWLGRERHVVERLLQQWLHHGLDKLLAGDAPTWLDDLARQTGLPHSAAIAAMLQRIEIQEDEPQACFGGRAVAQIGVCASCHTPVVRVRRPGVQRGGLLQCGNPTCLRGSTGSARVTRLDDWRQRRRLREGGTPS